VIKGYGNHKEKNIEVNKIYKLKKSLKINTGIEARISIWTTLYNINFKTIVIK